MGNSHIDSMKAIDNNMDAVENIYKNAMIFEGYAMIWRESLRYTDQLVRQIDKSYEETDAKMVDISLNLCTIDDDYKETRKFLKRSKRKRLLIGIGLPVVIIVYAAIAFASHNSRAMSVLFRLGTLGMLIISGLCIYNIVKAHANSKEIKKHTAKALTHDKQVAQNNLNAYASYQKKLESQKNQVMSKRQLIVSELKKVSNILNEIYSLKIQDCYIIDVNCRGLVATSTIYEYLRQGRCQTLYGHGGAYDTFRKDKQAEEIISSLDEMNSKLDKVIANQKILKKTLDSISYTLGDIKSEVASVGQKLDGIKRDSAITAAAATQSAAAESYIASVVWRNS